MIIRNYTPFVPFYWESEDRDRDLFATFLLKATFRIEQGRLVPEQVQQPVTLGDEHYDEPTNSSVRLESDLCPLKSGTDMFVVGHAIAPNLQPARHWEVSFQISGDWGKHQKTLRVTGPREWRKTLLGWRLTEPEPVQQVLMQYEHAYGGRFQLDKDTELRFDYNPFGKGYAPAELQKRVDSISAPQIESPDVTFESISATSFPQGFGPICKAWKSRTDIAGTYDQTWLDNDWPHLPEDFDFDFYMAAHPDMQLKDRYLSGDEVVEITGMSVQPIRFQLPEYQIAAFFTSADEDVPAGNIMDCDTLCIDTAAMTATLVWRIATPREKPFREIESRMLIRGVPPRGR